MRLEQTMIGSPVFTQEGARIGKVKEIHGQFFKVDAAFQPDYWVSEDYVASGSGAEVRLTFTEDRLSDYKLGDPENYTADGGGTLVDDGSGIGAGIEFDSGKPGAGSVRGRPTEAYGQESAIPMPAPSASTAWADVASEYQSRWQTHYGSGGGRWEDFEPGYRYGHEMAYDPRYQGREFTEMEPELRQNYGEWSQRYGYRYDDREWDRIREHAREAMTRGRIDRAA